MPEQVEEVPICRVCRSEGTAEEPLFHPCRCSGSIKYVHQVCLEEWLAHSNKKYCELCSYEYAFSPLYDPNMPESIPKRIIIKQMLANVTSLTLSVIRTAIVLGMWAFLLPYLVYWVVRVFIWSAQTVVHAILGHKVVFLDDPSAIATAAAAAATASNSTNAASPVAAASMRFKGFDSWHAWYMAAQGSNSTATLPATVSRTGILNDAGHIMLFMYSSTQFVLRSCTQMLGSMLGVSISDTQVDDVVEVAVELVAKCFEGSLVTMMAVVVFFLVFVLRDWISANEPLAERIPELEIPPQLQAEELGPDALGQDRNQQQQQQEQQLDQQEGGPDVLDDVRMFPLADRPDGEQQNNRLHVQARPIVAENPRHRPLFEQPAFDLPMLDDIPPGERPVRPFRRRLPSTDHRSDDSDQAQAADDNTSGSWIVTDESEPESAPKSATNADESIATSLSAPESESSNQAEAKLNTSGHTADVTAGDVSTASGNGTPDRISVIAEIDQYLSVLGKRSDIDTETYDKLVTELNDMKHTLYAELDKDAQINSEIDESSASEDSEDRSNFTHPATPLSNTWSYADEVYEEQPEDEPRSSTSSSGDSSRPGQQNVATSSTTGHEALHAEREPSLPSNEANQTQEGSDNGSAWTIVTGKHPTDTRTLNHNDSGHGAAASPTGSTGAADAPDTADAAGDIGGEVGHNAGIQPQLLGHMPADNYYADPVRLRGQLPDAPLDEQPNEAEHLFEDLENNAIDNVGFPFEAENGLEQLRAEGVELLQEVRGQQQQQQQGQQQQPFLDDQDFDPNDFDAADGLLEAMGIRGPFFNAMQYFMLLLMVVILVLTCCVWAPLIIGRLFLALNPLRIFLYSIHICVTVIDATTELVLDTLVPFVWMTIKPAMMLLTNTVGPLIVAAISLLFPAVKSTLAVENGTLWDAVTSPEVQGLILEHLREPWIIGLVFPWLAADKPTRTVVGIVDSMSTAAASAAAAASSPTGMAGRMMGLVTTPVSLVGSVASGVATDIMALLSLFAPNASDTNLLRDLLQLKSWERALWLKFISWGIPIHHISTSLRSVAAALTLKNRLALIGVGVVVSVYNAWLIYTYTPRRYRHTMFYREARTFLRMAKITLFIFIEILLFPMLCGYCLDISITPLLPNADRSAHYWAIMNNTLSRRALFWMIGLGFMIYFARFVLYCRRVMRPGLLWFIRDPNDPEFHPMREALEDRAIAQHNKIVRSALMYCAILLACFLLPSIGAVTLAPSLFPMQWNASASVTENSSNMRLDASASVTEYSSNMLLPVFILFFIAKWGRPYELVRFLFERWWKFAARETRLSELIIGERDILDEGTWVIRKMPWMPVLLPRLFMPTHAVVDAFEQVSSAYLDKLRCDSNAQGNIITTSEFKARLQTRIDEILAPRYPWVQFDLDGMNVRAPIVDTVAVVQGRHMFVPVDDDGRPIEQRFNYEAADYPERRFDASGEQIYPDQGLPPRAPDSDFRDLRFKPEQHGIIYVPPKMKARVIMFLALIWVFIAAMFMSSLLLAMAMGKSICKHMFFMPRNDLVALLLGGQLLLVLCVAAYQGGGYVASLYDANGDWVARLRESRRHISQTFTGVWKVLVTGLVFFGILPVVYGLLVEVYFVTLVRAYLEHGSTNFVYVRTAVQAVSHNWIFSSLHLWVVVSGLRFFPNTRITRNVDRMFTGPPHTWLVGRGIIEIALPIFGVLLGVALLPLQVAALELWVQGSLTKTALLDLLFLANVKLVARWSMIILITAISTGAIWQACIVYKRWSRLARDQAYLVGQQLHNLQEDAAADEEPAQAVGSEADAINRVAAADGADDVIGGAA
ncbi:hypothetical protein GGI07_003693 [Coemansia sp. Benny D115]|nr:hypothetical protein GGI07_003693 [Coemansia sp. Benny D115]